MAISANLLKENNYSIQNILADNYIDNFEIKLLEFNDDIHKICVESDIEFYKILSESALKKSNSLTIQEGLINSTVKFISNIIQKFIDTIKSFFNFIKRKYGEEQAKRAEEIRKDFKARSNGKVYNNSGINKNKEYTIFIFPKDSEVEDKYFAACYNNLQPLMDKALSGEDIAEDSINKAIEMGFLVLSKSVPCSRTIFNNKVKNNEDFKELVSSNCCYKEKDEMTFVEYDDKFGDRINDFKRYKNSIASKVSYLGTMFEKNKIKYESRSLNLSESSKNSIMLILGGMKQLLDTVLWYSNKLVSSYSSFLNYYINTLNTALNESSMIHGEEFDGDTLFDNNDSRDFNRTEWLDLSLATESYMISSILSNTRRNIAIKEAKIFTSNDINMLSKLTSMREAEIKKASEGIMNVIKEIGRIIDEFIAKMQDAVSVNANIIKNNQDIIYNKPFKFNTASSQGDILSGIERIKKDLTIKPFDYNSMKDDLKDDKTFFKKHIEPSLNSISKSKERSGFHYDDNMSIANYCKAYFGAPLEGLEKCTYDAATLQKIIIENKDFLESPHAFIRQIKGAKSELENQAKRFQSELDNSAKNNTETEANNSINNESNYYSELYGRYIPLSEIDIKGENPETNNTSNKIENDQSSSNKVSFQSCIKVWLNTYRTVLMAKITGAEFIRKELMSIIKTQIKAYKPKSNNK